MLIRDGRAEAGKRPSRAVNNHRAIYRRHPAIQGLVNAYTVSATAFSVTGAELNSRTIPESYIFVRNVGRLPYGLQFTDPESVARHISPEQPVVVLENDGVLVAGKSVLETYDRLEVLESTAEALIESLALGGFTPMGSGEIRALEAKFLPNG